MHREAEKKEPVFFCMHFNFVLEKTGDFFHAH